MKPAKELWRTLRVGDRVRIVEYPPEFLQPGYQIFPEAVRVYNESRTVPYAVGVTKRVLSS